MRPSTEHSEPITAAPPNLRLRIIFATHAMLGPGKIDLLQAIAETGSIAAAGRSMGMSYKRAWMLVEAMNAAFRDPLVASARGGAKGGGAVVTPTGQEVLRHYRALEQITAQAGIDHISALRALLSDMSDGK